jgi:hypothetical protein
MSFLRVFLIAFSLVGSWNVAGAAIYNPQPGDLCNPAMCVCGSCSGPSSCTTPGNDGCVLANWMVIGLGPLPVVNQVANQTKLGSLFTITKNPNGTNSITGFKPGVLYPLVK